MLLFVTRIATLWALARCQTWAKCFTHFHHILSAVKRLLRVHWLRWPEGPGVVLAQLGPRVRQWTVSSGAVLLSISLPLSLSLFLYVSISACVSLSFFLFLCLSLCLHLSVYLYVYLFLCVPLICSEVCMWCGCFHRAFESELSSGISFRLHLLPELCTNRNIISKAQERRGITFLSDLKNQNVSKEVIKRKEEQIVRPCHSHKEPRRPRCNKTSPFMCSFPNTMPGLTGERAVLGSSPGSTAFYCVILSKLLNLSEPQFPSLQNKTNNSYYGRVLWGLNSRETLSMVPGI